MGRSPFWVVLNKYAPMPLPGNENVKGAQFVKSCCWRPSWLKLILLTTQSPDTGIRLSCMRSKLASTVWVRKLHFQLLLIACAKLSASDGEGCLFLRHKSSRGNSERMALWWFMHWPTFFWLSLSSLHRCSVLGQLSIYQINKSSLI